MRQWLLQFCLDRCTGGEDFKVSINTHEKAMNGKLSSVHVKGLYHCICTACAMHFERLKTIDLFFLTRFPRLKKASGYLGLYFIALL